MDQNQTVGSPDNDLQQAIDNISNSTNSDPVFSDEAPAPISDDDPANYGDPAGPFPLPDTDATIGVVTEGPEPIAPLDPISLPDLSVSGENPADATVVTKSGFADSDPADPMNNQDPSMMSDNGDYGYGDPSQSFDNGNFNQMNNNFDQPNNDFNQSNNNFDQSNNDFNQSGNNFDQSNNGNDFNSANNGNTDVPADNQPNDSAQDNHASNRFGNNHNNNGHTPTDSHHSTAPSANARQIRNAALQQVIPHLDKLSIDDSEKFRLCKDAMEDLHDYSVLDQAYKAASNIQDESERTNSLLYLIESIDSM